MVAQQKTYRCPQCKEPLPWRATMRGQMVRCPTCIQRHKMPDAPDRGSRDPEPRRPRVPVTLRPPSVQDPRYLSHLVAEVIPPDVRLRLLQRLSEQLACGVQDPEMLYLGARYALSLGQTGVALRFLKPLQALLRQTGGPSPADFPVGLLYVTALHDAKQEQEREAKLAELRDLAAKHPRLERALCVSGCDPQGPQLAGAPRRLLHWASRHSAAVDLLANTGATETRGQDGVPLARLWRLARVATSAYDAGDLATARRSLEQMLLADGDYPAVLRNLITVASEQHDMEAYCRYWRRYVKLLLWRIMRHDQTVAAYEELVGFYTRVAETTNREFHETGQKAVDKLRTPGLLPRWLESHGALIWLESARKAHRDQQTALVGAAARQARLGRLAVMRFWFRAFYPEFLPYLETGDNPDHDPIPHRRRTTSRLAVDPAETVLTRFAEWSRFQFALTKNDDAHAEAITALSGFVARLPLGVVPRKDDAPSDGKPPAAPVNGQQYEPFVKRLTRMLGKNELDPPPFRRMFQNACSLALQFPLNRFLKKDDNDWAGLIEFYEDPDQFERLSPDLRLFVAIGHCIRKNTFRGLDIACRVLPDLSPEDLKEGSQCRSLWNDIIKSRINQITQDDASRRQQAFDQLKQRVESALRGPEQAELCAECLKEIEEVSSALAVRDQVDQAVARSKTLVQQKRFEEAKNVVRELPDGRDDVRELKTNLLSQIEDAQQMDGINERIESAVERSKTLVGKGKFSEARRAIRELPDYPDELVQLKNNLLGQITQVENDAQQAQKENSEIMLRLSSKGIDFSKLMNVAAQNNVSMSNALQFNAFLKAVEAQI